MILYVDETGNDKYFIVAGLLVKSKQDVDLAYKKFKKKIRGFKISDKYKSRTFTEFKSTILDNDQQRLKIKMLEEIVAIDGSIIYSCYIKKNRDFNQILKESVYITLLSSIIGSLEEETTVIFDGFNKRDFEDKIVESASIVENVVEIYPKDSQSEAGLQFVDNICSVLRKNKSNDDPWNFYRIIKDKVVEI